MQQGSPDIHFVTTLTRGFVPGLLALIRSLHLNSGIRFRFNVVTYENIGHGHRQQIRSEEPAVEFVPVENLGAFPEVRTRDRRLRRNLNKPLIWRLPYAGPLVYIDSDFLCLRSLESLQQWDEITAVVATHALGVAPGTHPAYLPSTIPAWNAGLFAFRPSEETFQGLCEQARGYTAPLMFGDQVILNDHFNRRPSLVRYASQEWNMATKMAVVRPDVYRATRTRLLHFAHPEKPWRDDPPHPHLADAWALWQRYSEKERR